MLVAHGVPLVNGRTFAELGHFAAVLTGLACYPPARGLPRRKTERAPRSNVPAQ
ncbi:rhomboid-like protein [Streptomyces sp. NPDC057136]|uniref:rhomboid-like protein n=1 Tax=Streptomyces sp. NPDC057136 TaxID=3346029 RepID=UPI003637D7ED